MLTIWGDQMREKDERRKWHDFLFPLLLLGLIFIFLLPLLAGWEKMFFDDIAFLFYPQQVFLSRCLGQGVIPWWDPHICAGATPFYTRIFQSSLYPLNWLFLVLDRLNPGRDYFWLVRAPLALHYLLAAAFSFFFARIGLRLNRVGSFVLAAAYTLSPTMIYMSTYPPEVFVQAWLPLFCLCLLMFAKRGSRKWLAGGVLAFAFSSPGGDFPFFFHCVLTAGLFGAGLIVLFFIRREGRRAGRVIVGGILIFGLGALLAGIYWANMIEGLQNLGRAAAEEAEELSGPGQSLFPVYLITLFVPDFFGGVTSHHTWGAAFHIHCSLNDASLLGGLASFLLIVMGWYAGRRKEPVGSAEPSPRELWWTFFGIFIFSLFVVLGTYTPVYCVLRALIPILKMPYSIRFRSIECFAVAGLLGTSASLLWDREITKKFPLVLIYFSAVVAFVVLALIWPYRAREIRFSPGWNHISSLGDWPWLVRGPLLYLVAGGAILILGAKLARSRIFIRLLIILVVGECFFFAYRGLYQNRILNRRDEDISAVRYRGPAEHPEYRLVRKWISRALGNNDMHRWAYYRSYFDNLSWIDETLSTLGFDVKPLQERFQEAVERLVKGFPYELWPRDWSSWFWPNMSVRYAVTEKPVPFSKWKLINNTRLYYLYELSDVLPRFYFQDRWVTRDEDDEQLEALLDFDLRDAGYCSKDTWGARPLSEEYPRSEPLEREEWLEHFALHQEENRIISADFSDPNRVELEVEVSRPSMLVLTDVWHRDWRVAMGKFGEALQKVYRINYLQRGVWCRPGNYKIVMQFLPSSLKRGLGMTAIGIAALIFLFLIVGRLNAGKRK